LSNRSKPFKLAAGKKAKKIVQLEATEPLAKDTRKDTPVPIKIIAFATDAPEKIRVSNAIPSLSIPAGISCRKN